MFELLDDDGYPTVDALFWVEKFDDFANTKEWFAFIKSIWWTPEWGWFEEDTLDDIFAKSVRQYSLSTGGWSGNESIIAAMQRNHMMWSMCWLQSRRGGHYIFQIKNRD